MGLPAPEFPQPAFSRDISIISRNKEEERKDERKNSANAKLKLLVYGVQDNPEIFQKYQKQFEHF